MGLPGHVIAALGFLVFFRLRRDGLAEKLFNALMGTGLPYSVPLVIATSLTSPFGRELQLRV